MTTTVNVLYLPGTNCHVETMQAIHAAGGTPRLRFAADLTSSRERLDDADILCVPGGFSFGDHLGAGTVAGWLLRMHLADQLVECRKRPMLGICNGFQILLRAGCFGPGTALKTNENGTFSNAPAQRHLIDPDNTSPWLSGLGGQVMEFPRANGQGRFVSTDRSDRAWQAAVHYLADDGGTTVAGVTSADGLAFGLMDHPERAHDRAQRAAFFENGIKAAT